MREEDESNISGGETDMEFYAAKYLDLREAAFIAADGDDGTDWDLLEEHCPDEMEMEAEECKRAWLAEFGDDSHVSLECYKLAYNAGRESVLSRITELEQRLASKEDALAAALLVIEASEARVAELEADKAKYIHNSIAVNCNRCEESHIKLQADSRQLAEAVIKGHRCCLYDENNTGDFAESCLLDSGETCKYNKPSLGQCDKYDKCQCPACQTARRCLSAAS